jgi:hypothetical protein
VRGSHHDKNTASLELGQTDLYTEWRTALPLSGNKAIIDTMELLLNEVFVPQFNASIRSNFPHTWERAVFASPCILGKKGCSRAPHTRQTDVYTEWRTALPLSDNKAIIYTLELLPNQVFMPQVKASIRSNFPRT